MTPTSRCLLSDTYNSFDAPIDDDIEEDELDKLAALVEQKEASVKPTPGGSIDAPMNDLEGELELSDEEHVEEEKDEEAEEDSEEEEEEDEDMQSELHVHIKTFFDHRYKFSAFFLK